jgi:indole-3-glycerol phosphate synthase
MTDYLSSILARKRRENERRRRHLASIAIPPRHPSPERARRALEALRRRPGAPPSVMAEVKFRSPSAGEIRPKHPGDAVRIALAYQKGGASVVSVLADGPGFGGSPLLVRRVAESVDLPVLYKGFVLDPIQVDLAFDVGASLVLLLVRALDRDELGSLIARTRALGMEPVVEAACPEEVDQAVDAGSTIVGVNARDLETFRIDKAAAAECVTRIPPTSVAVYMSGIRTAEDFLEVAGGRADAVLIGEGLMRAQDPGARLAELLRSV